MIPRFTPFPPHRKSLFLRLFHMFLARFPGAINPPQRLRLRPVTPPSRGAIRASGGRSPHWNEGGPELELWGAASPGREAGGGHVMGSSSRHTPSMWPGTNRRSWTQQTQCVQVIPPTANGARWVRSRRRPAQGLHPCSSQWFLKVFRKFGVPGDCTPALAHGFLMF